MIEKLSAAVSDPAFRDSKLPRACSAYAHGSHAARCRHIVRLLAKLGITIQDRIAVRTRFQICFPQSLHDTGSGRMFRDIEMDNSGCSPPPTGAILPLAQKANYYRSIGQH